MGLVWQDFHIIYIYIYTLFLFWDILRDMFVLYMFCICIIFATESLQKITEQCRLTDKISA